MRYAILLHRYLGIALGAVVSLWCLSAFVMMYVQYPEFTDDERVAGLDTLELGQCCFGPAAPPPMDGRPDATLSGPDGPLALPPTLERFRIEMLDGAPVLRLFGALGQTLIDLRSGQRLTGIDAAAAGRISERFSRNMGIDATADYLGEIERDQWTVYASYHPHRPLHRFRAGDDAGSEWYVSAPSGEVVQITTLRERFWNWIGAVTHWIYFTSLRQHTLVWSQLVIGLTILSTFLVVLGVYIGIKRLKRRRSGRWSPFRGPALWHHYAGLTFGVLIMTWLVSGFFSMNPWGALEGRSFAAERERLQARPLAAQDLRALLSALPSAELPPDTVRLDSTLVAGRLAIAATDSAGRRRLLDPIGLDPVRRDSAFFESAAARLRPDARIAAQGWMHDDDAYYFNHHAPMPLPVYRVRYDDGERFYLDAVTGELVHAVDASRKTYRWVFEALHRGDFARIARMRPVWDLFMLPLLLGVTVIALTGSWLGIKRLMR